MAGAARKPGAGLFRERRRGGSCAKREEAEVLFIIGASSEAQELPEDLSKEDLGVKLLRSREQVAPRLFRPETFLFQPQHRSEDTGASWFENGASQ